MKTKYFSFCIALGVALTLLQTPALGADKDKKATAPVAAAAAKTVEKSEKTVPVGTSAKAATVGTSLTATAVNVKTETVAPQAPQAKESSSFFGGLKKFFGGGDKKGAEAPQGTLLPQAPTSSKTAVPMPPMPLPPPPPPLPRINAPSAAAPTLDEGFAAREKAVDSKALDRAEKVAKLFGTKEKLVGAFRGMTMMMMPMVNMENQGKMEMIQKSINDAADKLAEDREDMVLKNKALFLAKTFSADELSQMEKFYESPVGKKLIMTSDEIARDDAMFIQRITMIENKKAREAVIREMKRNDLKIPKGME